MSSKYKISKEDRLEIAKELFKLNMEEHDKKELKKLNSIQEKEKQLFLNSIKDFDHFKSTVFSDYSSYTDEEILKWNATYYKSVVYARKAIEDIFNDFLLSEMYGEEKNVDN